MMIGEKRMLEAAVFKITLVEIANHYGLNLQTKQACQELAELIVALTKGKQDNIIEEIADVEIMIEQIKHLYDIPEENIQEVKEAKIKRQVKRISEEN